MVKSALGLKGRVDTLPACFLGFIRFTSGATPAVHDSMTFLIHMLVHVQALVGI